MGRWLVLLILIALVLNIAVPAYSEEKIGSAPDGEFEIAYQEYNQHGSNENLRLGNLWNGIESYAAILGNLGW